MYQLIAIISVLVRNFVLPNPFEVLGENVTLNLLGMNLTFTPLTLNWCTEGILAAITGAIVGLYYIARSNPARGSFLYLLFYCVHVGALYLMCLFHFAWWGILLTLLLYVGFHVVFNFVSNRIRLGGAR